MELVYEVDRNGSIVNARFEGLDGRERVLSLKQALTALQVRNPALTFTENAKSGQYDQVSDEEYERMLHAVETVSQLWRYRDGEGSAQASMNALMLLANAIELIGSVPRPDQ